MKWIPVFIFLTTLWCGSVAHAQNFTLSWKHDGMKTAGYYIFCGPDLIPKQQVGDVPVGTLTFKLHGQTVGATVYCRVQAYNVTGGSGYSNTVPSVIIANGVNVDVIVTMTPQYP